MKKVINLISEFIDKLICKIVIFLTLVLSALMATGVFYRYVLNNSIYWSGEVSRYLLVYITFLGATIAYKRGAHVGIDIIVEKFPEKVQKIFRIVITISFIIFWLIILTKSFKLYPLYLLQKTATLEIPYAVPFTALPLSAAIWIIHGLDELLFQIQRLKAEG